MSIQRYDRKYDLEVDCHCAIAESSDGDYVTYADHALSMRKVLEALRGIVRDLPFKRDWLDPEIEERAVAILAEYKEYIK